MPSYPPHRFDAAPAASRRRYGRTALWALLALLVLLGAAWWLGPRNTLGAAMPTSRALPPQNMAALSEWIAASEAAIPDIKPGNAKGIVWAGAAGQRTPWSVVYIHGFSASRMETAPLAEAVASQLGANLFYTRLSGHGRSDPAALGEASVQDWMADTLEAARIGQTLGERVLLIGCSTGATLGAWLGMSGEAARVNAYVFVSPNFGPKDRRADLVNGPWGQKLALLIQGPTRDWTPQSPQEAQAWTSSYPTKALFPMMALVKSVRESDLSLFQTPVLVLYSERDETVEPAQTLAAFTRLGSPHKSIEPVDYSKSLGQHVLAGAIKDPAAVAPMAETMVQWLKSLPMEPR
jgi:alpha-beta hydrolase superfamily lysophospholipase